MGGRCASCAGNHTWELGEEGRWLKKGQPCQLSILVSNCREIMSACFVPVRSHPLTLVRLGCLLDSWIQSSVDLRTWSNPMQTAVSRGLGWECEREPRVTTCAASLSLGRQRGHPFFLLLMFLIFAWIDQRPIDLCWISHFTLLNRLKKKNKKFVIDEVIIIMNLKVRVESMHALIYVCLCVCVCVCGWVMKYVIINPREKWGGI